MVRPLRGLVIAAAFALSTAAAAQVQVNQTFIPQGPSPKFGAIDLVQSGDAPPNGTVGGAVQAILLDPALGSQTMFIAGVNGGIWRTTDGGASWKALTDNQASLSIASLALDPTDATGKTLIAGIGITSNGGWNNFNVGNEFGRGGARTGLLYSADGGNTWSALGAASLTGQSVIGVAAAGGTILAATFEEQNPRQTTAATGAYGLYRSANGGQSFGLVSGSGGLPAGPVTALVADPQNPGNCGTQNSCTFYASVTSASTPSATGVYVSHNSGQSWTPVFTSATAVSGGTNVITGAATFQLVPKLAAGPNGSVAIAIAQLQPSPSDSSCVQPNCNGQQLTGLYLSQNGGTAWSALKVPDTNKGVMQAAVNLAVAIDPTNTSIVYVTGDGIENNPFTVAAFRVQGATATSITLARTSNGSTAHSDSRGLAVDSAGNLWMTSDGGVYMRSNPQSDNGAWTGFNTSTLQVQETYSVAYDTLNKRLAAADAGYRRCAPIRARKPRVGGLGRSRRDQRPDQRQIHQQHERALLHDRQSRRCQSDGVRCERQSDQPEYGYVVRLGRPAQLQLQPVERPICRVHRLGSQQFGRDRQQQPLYRPDRSEPSRSDDDRHRARLPGLQRRDGKQRLCRAGYDARLGEQRPAANDQRRDGR